MGRNRNLEMLDESWDKLEGTIEEQKDYNETYFLGQRLDGVDTRSTKCETRRPKPAYQSNPARHAQHFWIQLSGLKEHGMKTSLALPGVPILPAN